jgi:hypothetical protein
MPPARDELSAELGSSVKLVAKLREQAVKPVRD